MRRDGNVLFINAGTIQDAEQVSQFADELKAMSEAIQADCEQVDDHKW